MRCLALAAFATIVASLPAQNDVTAIFLGRFDFVSLDAPRERPNGSITALSGFDLSYVTPGGGAVARPWTPTTGHASMMGDSIGDGDFTRFDTYFPNNWDFCSPFVKHADRGLIDPPVYFTVRDNRVVLQFDVFDQNGTQRRSIRSGDFFRWTHNGNIELFITQDLLMKADGLDPLGGAEFNGANAITQDAQGNLYYSPQEGGTWVLGNDPAAPLWCERAGIIMIDSADITYDANGNVQDVVADSAHVIYNGNQSGPAGEPSVVQMALNAGAMDYAGNPIPSYYDTYGLAVDPTGGTTTVSVPRQVGGQTVYDTIPNLLFHSDNGTHAGTLFSTQPNGGNPGSIAVINGVSFGSSILGVPASGAWWGVQQNTAAFSPTMMGFALIDAISAEPFVADAPRHGAMLSTDPMINIDFYPGPSTPTVFFLAPGPIAAGTFQPSVDVTFLFGPNTFTHLYATSLPTLVLGLGASNPNGYITFSTRNPTNPAFLGATLIFQGVRIVGPNVELSTPVTLQFK